MFIVEVFVCLFVFFLIKIRKWFWHKMSWMFVCVGRCYFESRILFEFCLDVHVRRGNRLLGTRQVSKILILLVKSALFSSVTYQSLELRYLPFHGSRLLMIMMISEFSNIWDIHFFLPSFYRLQDYKIRGLIRSEKRSALFSVGLPWKAHVYVYPWEERTSRYGNFLYQAF